MIYSSINQADNAFYFKLFQCCVPVKGHTRSVICDIQRGDLHLVPNGLLDILHFVKEKDITAIKANFENKYDDVIDEYFSFLINNELGFWCDKSELELFPDLSLEWKTPCVVTNIIIDINAKDIYNYTELIQQLNDLRCRALEIRCFEPIALNDLKNILSYFDYSEIESIYLLLCSNENYIEDDYKDLILKYGRIETIIIHSHFIDSDKNYNTKRITYSQQKITSETHCGVVAPAYFSSNIELFTEAQLHNTCLNRKIAIDVDGNIKNCPSMPHSYGNIKDTTLQEALEHPDFKKYWYIHKDQIEVCKDCEFRYICTDCRAYIEDPHNLYSKPLKCGYNPYTCEWEEWSTNPLKQKAIEYYGMQELVKREEEKAE